MTGQNTTWHLLIVESIINLELYGCMAIIPAVMNIIACNTRALFLFNSQGFPFSSALSGNEWEGICSFHTREAERGWGRSFHHSHGRF